MRASPHGVFSLQARGQEGYVLISVVVSLSLIAAVTLAVSHQGVVLRASVSGELERETLHYLTESGIEHARWQLAQSTSCAGYQDISDVALTNGVYSASLSTSAGSPVTISATGVHSNGNTLSRDLADVIVYGATNSVVVAAADNGGDNQIEGKPDKQDHSHGAADTFKLKDSPTDNFRGIVKFDLSPLPVGAKIRAATLQLNVEGLTNGVTTATIYPLLSDWEQADSTWLVRSGSTAWANAGGDYSNTVAGSFDVTTTGVLSIDVTALADAWVSGRTANYGLIMITPETGSDVQVTFTSSESTSAPGPKLLLDYACECGTSCDPIAGGTEPVAHWKLDDASGSTAIDSVGGHDGTLTNGPVWSGSGKIDGALDFDGSNDAVIVPHEKSLEIEKELTIVAWFNNTSPSFSGSYRILSKEKPGTNDNFWIAAFSNELAVGIGGSIFTTFGLGLQTNRWYHVAMTFQDDSDTLFIFLDGVIVEKISTTATIKTNTDDLWIGNSWQAKTWDGLLDDVRLYDVALSDAEIAALAGVSVPGGGGGGGGGSSCDGSYEDSLESIDFAGSTGSLDWSATPWIETGESDGPGSGDIRILMDLGELALQLQDNDNGGEGVERDVNLGGASSASLSYFYYRYRLDDSNDYAVVEISANGSTGPWFEIARHQGPGTDDSYFSRTIDISAYASASTRLRFLTSPTMGGRDIVFFDDFVIECRP